MVTALQQATKDKREKEKVERGKEKDEGPGGRRERPALSVPPADCAERGTEVQSPSLRSLLCTELAQAVPFRPPLRGPLPSRLSCRIASSTCPGRDNALCSLQYNTSNRASVVRFDSTRFHSIRVQSMERDHHLRAGEVLLTLADESLSWL